MRNNCATRKRGIRKTSRKERKMMKGGVAGEMSSRQYVLYNAREYISPMAMKDHFDENIFQFKEDVATNKVIPSYTGPLTRCIIFEASNPVSAEMINEFHKDIDHFFRIYYPENAYAFYKPGNAINKLNVKIHDESFVKRNSTAISNIISDNSTINMDILKGGRRRKTRASAKRRGGKKTKTVRRYRKASLKRRSN